MEKMVFVAEEIRRNGDAYELCATFDINAARKKLADTAYHLTKSEMERTTLSISGYTIPVDGDDVDSETAWLDACVNNTRQMEPDYYEEPECNAGQLTEYEALEKDAIDHMNDERSRETADALGEWFERNDQDDWNGESYRMSADGRYSLFRVYDVPDDFDWDNDDVPDDAIHYEVRYF